MLDIDVAELYGVDVKSLRRAVKRNSERFPADFMFHLTAEEAARAGPAMLAFTDLGVVMLAGVLKSERAVQASLDMMRSIPAAPTSESRAGRCRRRR